MGNTIKHRILHRIIKQYTMKVTAIIDDTIIREAMKYSHSPTITDALKTALNEYIRMQKLKVLSKNIKQEPLNFSHSADELRNLNRGL